MNIYIYRMLLAILIGIIGLALPLNPGLIYCCLAGHIFGSNLAKFCILKEKGYL